MKMMKKSASKRFAALVVLGAMLFALAAPQASAVAKETTSSLKTESYTVTDTDPADLVMDSVTEKVTYQIGGKTIIVKRSEKHDTLIEEYIDTYTLSQPLKAMERIDDMTAAWDVPAGTKVTMIESETVYEDGKVCLQDTWEDSYVLHYVTNRIFSRLEIISGVADDAWLNSDDVELAGDKSITIEKGKMYQMVREGPDYRYAAPGNFVFRGV